MERTNQIAAIRAACIKANPEIVEAYVTDRNGQYVYRYKIGRDEWLESERFLTRDAANIAAFNSGKATFVRPIRLADVLLVLNKTSAPPLIGYSVRDGYGCWVRFDEEYNVVSVAEENSWNLRTDDLEQQSDETITFLAELLT